MRTWNRRIHEWELIPPTSIPCIRFRGLHIHALQETYLRPSSLIQTHPSPWAYRTDECSARGPFFVAVPILQSISLAESTPKGAGVGNHRTCSAENLGNMICSRNPCISVSFVVCLANMVSTITPLRPFLVLFTHSHINLYR
ncbi:hypothetical protein VTI28DRAFT_8207 [Corynascus sepedonium]